MGDPIPPTRDEIVSRLARMGVMHVDDAFIARCVEVSAITQRTLAMLPPPPDKSVEPAHVFTPPLGTAPGT